MRASAAKLRAFSREGRFALRMGTLPGASGPPSRGLCRRGQARPDDGVRVDKVRGIQLPLEPIAFAEMLALKCRAMVAGIPPSRPGGASRWACTVVNSDP